MRKTNSAYIRVEEEDSEGENDGGDVRSASDEDQDEDVFEDAEKDIFEERYVPAIAYGGRATMRNDDEEKGGMRPMSMETSSGIVNDRETSASCGKRSIAVFVTICFFVFLVFVFTSGNSGETEGGLSGNYCRRVDGDDVNLGHRMQPQHYDMLLDIGTFGSSQYVGRVEISTKILYDPTVPSCVTLHADRSLSVSNVTVDGRSVEHRRPSQFSDIIIVGPFVASESSSSVVSIGMTFEGEKNVPRSNGHLSLVQTPQHSARMLMHTGPAGARKIFPCFDTPSSRAEFSVTLRVDSSLFDGDVSNIVALANFPEVEREYRSLSARKFVDVRFGGGSSSMRLSPDQLVIYVVGKDDVRSVEIGGVGGGDAKIWYPRDILGNDERISDAAVNALEREIRTGTAAIASWLGSESTANYVVLSDSDADIGGNLGLVLLRSSDALEIRSIERAESNIDNDGDITVHLTEAARRIAWEGAARQWFGGRIGPSDWSKGWMPSAVASVVVDTAMRDTIARYDDAEIEARCAATDADGRLRTRLLERLRTVREDSFQATRPLLKMPSSSNESEATQSIDAVNLKAREVLRMIAMVAEAQSGKDAFRDALAGLVATSAQYETIDEAKLWRAFDGTATSVDTSVVSFDTMASRWIAFPGYPLVEFRCESGDVVATQERFYLSPSTRSLASFQYNTHNPGSGIAFGKGYEEAWSIPVRIPIGEDDDDQESRRIVGGVMGQPSVLKETCSANPCVFGDAGLASGPMWSSYVGVTADPVASETDACWKTLKNAAMAPSTKGTERAAMIVGALATAASDSRRSGSDAVRLGIEALNVTVSRDAVSEQLFVWQVVEPYLERIIAALKAAPDSNGCGERMQRAIANVLDLTVRSDAVREAATSEYSICAADGLRHRTLNIMFDALLRLGTPASVDTARRLLSPSSGWNATLDVYARVASSESSKTLEAVRSSLESCATLSTDESDVAKVTGCVKGAMHGGAAAIERNVESAPKVSTVVRSLLFAASGLSDLCRSMQDEESCFELSSSHASSGSMFERLHAGIRAAAAHARTRRAAMRWLLDERVWSSLHDGRFGQNSMRLASLVREVLSHLSSQNREDLAYVEAFERSHRLDKFKSGDYVVSDAILRGKEEMNALGDWWTFSGADICAYL